MNTMTVKPHGEGDRMPLPPTPARITGGTWQRLLAIRGLVLWVAEELDFDLLEDVTRKGRKLIVICPDAFQCGLARIFLEGAEEEFGVINGSPQGVPAIMTAVGIRDFDAVVTFGFRFHSVPLRPGGIWIADGEIVREGSEE